MRKNYLPIVIGLLLTIAVGLLAYLFVLRGPGNLSLPVVEDCFLQVEPCSLTLPTGGKMVFDITPKRPASTGALDFNVSFENIEPEAVSVRFKGENMDMMYLEYLKYPLARLEAKDKSISFGGKGGVFACSTDLMKWFALVDVKINGTVYEVPFKFETINVVN